MWEAFWNWCGKSCHSVCHYHLIHLNGGAAALIDGVFESLPTDKSRLLFKWVDIEEIKSLKIYPEFLYDGVKKLLDGTAQGIAHFISK